jgi:poly-gamma-glutamate capsule biosynthesis protein CapA/YwtB (metallophosphatase superfamily)
MFKKYLEFINEEKDRSLSIAFLGDIMGGVKSLPSIKFDDPFKYIKDFLLSHDFVCGDLETTLSGSTSNRFSEPRFTTDDILARKLSEFVDLLFTSNNHSFDYGIDGIERTLDILNSNGIQNIGTFKSEKEPRFKIIHINGKRVAFISTTQFINRRLNSYERISSIYELNPTWKKHILFYEDSIIESIIKDAKNNSDIVILYIHADTTEFSTRPKEEYVNLINKLRGLGVDFVIGSHPHDFQGASENSIYSLGNFFSTSYIPPQYKINYGCVCVSNFSNDRISSKFLPIATIKNPINEFYYVVPLFMIESGYIEWINENTKKDMMDKLEDIRKTFKFFNLEETKWKT